MQRIPRKNLKIRPKKIRRSIKPALGLYRFCKSFRDVMISDMTPAQQL